MPDTQIETKLKNLRLVMKKNNLDFYYVPSADPHQSEYVPDCWQRRRWISHFTGSAGDVLIGKKKAYLWTDPRYFLQAEQELSQPSYQLMKQVQGAAPIDQWLIDNGRGSRLAVDPRVINIYQAQRLQQALSAGEGELIALEHNLIDNIWHDKPPLPHQPARLHPVKHAGVSTADKLKELRHYCQAEYVDSIIVSALDSIAWLLNIRGSDIEFNPLVISYLIVTMNTATLFIDPDKLNVEIKDYLHAQNIEVKPYEQFDSALSDLQGNVWLDPLNSSWWTEQQLSHCHILLKRSPILLMKAIKNDPEIAGMKLAHEIDAVAVIKFLYWLEMFWSDGVTEVSAAEQLDSFRRQDPRFLEPSFLTISGFGDHSAIIHYHATPQSDKTIDDSSLYLVDSGGQYPFGTTDITRTIHLGTPTPQQCLHYTLVLKGHLALRHLLFPQGSCGEHINTVAHIPLWQAGLDFGHGTGHGVGCHLCVHEGPQAISSRYTHTPLQPGMIVSNEPGVYIDHHYGIRIENLCLISEKIPATDSLTQSGPFYGFSDLTLVPYSRKLINKDLLTQEEITWVNDYHQQVYTIIGPQLNDALKDWLKAATLPL